jgi:hypothetical protein
MDGRLCCILCSYPPVQSGVQSAQRACHYRRLRRRCRFQRSVKVAARRMEGQCDGKGSIHWTALRGLSIVLRVALELLRPAL